LEFPPPNGVDRESPQPNDERAPGTLNAGVRWKFDPIQFSNTRDVSCRLWFHMKCRIDSPCLSWTRCISTCSFAPTIVNITTSYSQSLSARYSTSNSTSDFRDIGRAGIAVEYHTTFYSGILIDPGTADHLPIAQRILHRL
jgi:hypothetical protein